MQKGQGFFWGLCVLAGLLVSGCAEKETEIAKTWSPKIAPLEIAAGSEYASGAQRYSPGTFFTPDYTPYAPEPKSEKKLRASSSSVSRTGGGSGRTVAGSGLRALSDYKTVYVTDVSSVPQAPASALASKAASAAGESGSGDGSASLSDASLAGVDSAAITKTAEPFTIADWGPQGVIPAEVRLPSFYVLFSEPVVPLGALSAPSDTSDCMTITPPLKGTFRWNGTRLLSFDVSEPVNPLEVYTITVHPQVTSLSGKALTGDMVFSTTAAALKIIWSAPGYSVSRWVDSNEVPPACAKELRVQFNYPVTAEKLKPLSAITCGGRSIRNFDVQQELADTVTYRWDETLPFESKVELKVAQTDGEACEAHFNTLSTFAYQYSMTDSSSGTHTNPVRLVFSHPVDESSVLGGLSAATASGEALPVQKENISVSGQTVIVHDLPVTFHSTYVISLTNAVKDVYARPLNTGKKDSPLRISVDVPGPASSVHFTDRGVKMLEKQFPHKMVFEYQNIDDGAYLLASLNGESPYGQNRSSMPAYVYDEGAAEFRFPLEADVRDERVFQTVNLDPFLTGGTGWVQFDAAVKLPRTPTKWDPTPYYWVSNSTSVQVTDLGVTVRYACNKVCALVSSLSDGRPVEGAWVYVFADDVASRDRITAEAPGAVTDKNGMAVIDLTDEKVCALALPDRQWKDPVILAVKGDDSVIFKPDSHSPWRNGVSARSVLRNITATPRIFMFSDRGLYKPGETISFRGIDRNQVLGSFLPYTGAWTVTLKEDTWREAKVFATVTGDKASENGGFYGSFAIPNDIEPGMYILEYRRNEGSSSARTTERVNIAFFERLVFQTAVSLPEVPVIAGDTLQASLSASYLAGGVLSQASYSASWFREPWYFRSDAPEFKQYTFGPVFAHEGRMHLASDEGQLNAEGRAQLSCATAGAGILGSPYRYRVSCDVTDVSNQQVSQASSVVVHPAGYYIGLSRPEGVSAFAKKNEKLSFSYRLATPDGNPVADEKTAQSLSGGNRKITVTLSREEWSLVQQQGIADIYSRYEKTDVVESEQTVALAASGKISVTPQEPGYHTLRLACTDSRERTVITEYQFYVTGSGRVSWRKEDATSLRLTPDASLYNPGDTAHILLESSLPAGDYLVTVEREGIFTEEVRHLEGPVHVLDVPVARNYVPVFYVSVSSYSVRQGQPTHEYGEVDLDKPKGYYGVTAVFVNPLVNAFTVTVESAKPSYRPGEEAEVTLTATKGGKPLSGAELTLLAVDRGVLDLINYHVPNPVDFFYNRDNFPLRVEGGDSRAYLMDPVTYEIKNLKGGDTGDDGKMEERSDFNPTAVFEPMLKTDADGRVTVRFKLPDTLTTYRLTAFGVFGELLALQEDEVMVQNPINVQQVLPREMRERDTAEVGVLVTNLDGKARTVTVSLSLEEKECTGRAFVDGESSRSLLIQSGESAMLGFDLAAQRAGNVVLSFTVESDVLKERLKAPLTISRPYLYETVTTTGVVEEPETAVEEAIVKPVTNPALAGNTGTLTLTLDATRLGLLGGAVQYVFEYPYGCLEQQSARILPLVEFGEYISVFNLESEPDDVHGCVCETFAEWGKLQHADGGFGYWPSSERSNLLVSARIAHIYARALERGYTEKELPVDRAKLLDYVSAELSRRERNASFYSDYDRAYLYYVLSLNGRFAGGNAAADRFIKEMLAKERQDIAVLALCGLTAVCRDGTASATARQAAGIIRQYLRPTARGVDLTNPHTVRSAFFSRQIAAESLALTLELYTLLDAQDEMNGRLLHALLSNQRGGYWKNTATTALVLDALYTHIKGRSLDSVNLSAEAVLGGTKLSSATFTGAAAKPVTEEFALSGPALAAFPEGTLLPLRFSRNGTGSLFYTASLQYAIGQETQPARDEGIGLCMRLYDIVTGEEIPLAAEKPGQVPVVALTSGRMYRAVVTVSTAYDRDYIALRAPVPSGAAILDATFATSPDAAVQTSGTGAFSDYGDSEDGWSRGTAHYMSNQVLYNSESQFFWDSFAKGTTTVEFRFRAVRRGVYPTPPVTAECMYEPEIFGRTGGLLYTVQ
ncbi:MAG: alpha-2-macroglobulin [Treponema sp.]|nr:alpha-2-macroglobulin [Treponema sp.]